MVIFFCFGSPVKLVPFWFSPLDLFKYIAMFNLIKNKQTNKNKDALFQSSLDSGPLLTSDFIFIFSKGDLMLYAANIKLMLLKHNVKCILTDHPSRNIHAVI